MPSSRMPFGASGKGPEVALFNLLVMPPLTLACEGERPFQFRILYFVLY